jgi:hypothetical protein
MMQDQMSASGQPGQGRGVPIHDAKAFEAMRRAGRLAAATLDMIGEHVKPGVTTEELDRLCHQFILDNGAVPAPLGYRGYPKATCISLNEVVCHGIPGPASLTKRDILNIDVTVILDGWYGDSRAQAIRAWLPTTIRGWWTTYSRSWRNGRGICRHNRFLRTPPLIWFPANQVALHRSCVARRMS